MSSTLGEERTIESEKGDATPLGADGVCRWIFHYLDGGDVKMAAITEKLEKDVRLERWLESRKGSRKIEYYYYHSADYPSFLTENETYKLHT